MEDANKITITSVSKDEPLVGRRELWSYYPLLLPMTNNPKLDNYVLVLLTTYWVVLGIWWFIFQGPRPGPSLPEGEYNMTIGWKERCAEDIQVSSLQLCLSVLLPSHRCTVWLSASRAIPSIFIPPELSLPFARTASSVSRSCKIPPLDLSQATISTMSTKEIGV
ncbi:hypothetical protein C8R48DRAFT_711840 [Suillus tomentosus]|nr:hypothetical protein C8R48DRAFT_711840 [Suillus tomentosus]